MSVLVFPSLISIHELLGIFCCLSLHLSQSLYHLIANVFELELLDFNLIWHLFTEY